MSEEETRDDIIEITNNEEPVACVSGVPQEAIIEEDLKEEVKEETNEK